MSTVRQLLKSKGTAVWSVTPDQSVYDALLRMAEKNVGALVVVQGKSLAGILSERDYSRKVILHGKVSRETLVREIMTPKVITVSPDQSLEKCMRIMTEKRIRHLPVMEGGELSGIVSIGDVLKFMVCQKDDEIRHLENYIGVTNHLEPGGSVLPRT